MALNNPAFNNPAFQDPKAVNTYPGGRQAAGLTPPAAATQYATAQHAGTDAAANAQLEGMYAAPAAGAIETDRMTVEDTVLKTVGLFADPPGHRRRRLGVDDGGRDRRRTRTRTILPWIIGMLGGFVLAHGRHLHVAQEGPPGADLRLRGVRGPLRRRHLGVLRVHLARHRRAGDPRDARASSA